MIILDDSKSLSILASDTSNGLGQIGCINPLVTENLNGSYELDFDIAISEKYFPLLKVGGLLKCRNNTSDQIFRIYFISKAINGVVNVKAQHITYDLSGVVVKPFTATGAVSAKNGMLSNVIGTTPFTMTTDITNTTSVFTLDIPRSFRECLGGYEGSLLDVFRGEYEWDNLSVNMLAHRGADNGVRIAYGKNLTDFTQEENNENVFDAVYGYALVDEVFYAPSGIYNKTGASQPKVKVVDFSSKYDSGNVPTPSDLYNDAQTYATNNDIEVPSVNIKISFVPLWQTEEYKDILPLERVSLGDTVHVFFEKLNVEATARVIKTVWNVNLDRYEEIELGSTKANLNTVINESVDSAVSEAMGDIDTGAIEDELNNLSDLITNGLGLFITKNVLIDGSTRIVLHNKPTVGDSDILYYIGANGLVVSTDGGSTWNAGFNPDGSAYFNAMSANIIKALQIYGSFLRFGDENSNYIDVHPYSVNDVPQGVQFEGTGTIRFDPQGAFLVHNQDEYDRDYNYFHIEHNSVNNMNLFACTNYNANFQPANILSLNSNNENSFFGATNYSYTNSGTAIANSMSLLSDSTGSTFELKNYYVGSNYVNGNNFLMSATSSAKKLTLENYNSGTNAQIGSRLIMESIANGGQITLQAYNTSGQPKSYITVKSGDMTLYSDSAIRMYSNASQDIQLVSQDDLLLQCSDKCEITAPNGLWVNGSRIA